MSIIIKFTAVENIPQKTEFKLSVKKGARTVKIKTNRGKVIN